MKKHILSKKCWCKPEVISFRKDNEDTLSDKIFEIASLFNDSMDNDKYNKIRKILKSTQMEIEVETGLKNFQVTMKELADARREVIDGLKSKLEELAEIEHDQWWKWAKTLMEKETLSKERIERWQKNMVPYKDLPEDVKEYDRKWARKILATLREEETKK